MTSPKPSNLRTAEFSAQLAAYLKDRGTPASLHDITAHFQKDLQTIRCYIHDFVDLEEGPVCVAGTQSRTRLFFLRSRPSVDAVLRGNLRRSQIADVLRSNGPTQLEAVARITGLPVIDVRKSIQSGPAGMFDIDYRLVPPTRSRALILSLPGESRVAKDLPKIHVRKPKEVSDPEGDEESTGRGFVRSVAVRSVDSLPPELTSPFDLMIRDLSSGKTSLSKTKLTRNRKTPILDLI